MQMLADHSGRFINTRAGYTGKVYHTGGLRRSGIYLIEQEGTLFPPNNMDISRLSVPTIILGDPAYPLLPWSQTQMSEHLSVY